MPAPPGPAPAPTVKALLVVPVPCDARLFGKLLTAVAKRWEAEHQGRTMTMNHLETRVTEFGDTVIVWDQPLPADEPQEVAR